MFLRNEANLFSHSLAPIYLSHRYLHLARFRIGFGFDVVNEAKIALTPTFPPDLLPRLGGGTVLPLDSDCAP